MMKSRTNIVKGGYFALLLGLMLVVSTQAFGVDKAELSQFFDRLCGDCHNSTNPKYGVLSARMGYDKSGHKNIGNSFYSNGAGCQRCHTNEGFVEYVNTGKVDPKTYIAFPSQPGCFTCHDPHRRGDMSLRTVKPVTLASGKVFDLGSGNLCANCHQAHGKAAETVKAMPAAKIPSYWGAHHGPQTDMIIGTSGYEFPGKKYTNSGHATELTEGCPQCHMTQPAGRFGLSPELGGHSFNIQGEVHHLVKVNIAGCIGCHSKMKQVKGKPLFSIKAQADFDLDGTIEPVQEEVLGLLDLFVNKEGTGYLQKLDPPMYNQDGSWNWTKSQNQRTLNQVAALYNYKLVLEDRSKGVHNSAYTVQLLYDSIEVLDPDFNISARKIYDDE